MTPIKTTPKDFFLQLGATIVLYVSVIALVNLVFGIINYAFPDVLAGSYYAGSIAFPISTLIVLVPILYVLEWMISKDLKATPEKDNLWVRRWRIYLTLFLSAATIAGDLITLINVYINGEITERFVYKFLAILIIFGVVFTYYLFERMTGKKVKQKILAWTGIILVIAAIVGGFVIVGSPYKQRAIKIDNQRVSDLQTIQWQIVSYWQQKEKLPTTLAELKDPISSMVIPMDPETKKDYEYIVKGATSFELCAVFGSKVEDPSGRGASYGGGRGDYVTSMTYPEYYDGGLATNWKHDVGRTCFTRTIDPDKYPPIEKPRRAI